MNKDKNNIGNKTPLNVEEILTKSLEKEYDYIYIKSKHISNNNQGLAQTFINNKDNITMIRNDNQIIKFNDKNTFLWIDNEIFTYELNKDDFNYISKNVKDFFSADFKVDYKELNDYIEINIRSLNQDIIYELIDKSILGDEDEIIIEEISYSFLINKYNYDLISYNDATKVIINNEVIYNENNYQFYYPIHYLINK